jgi:hypothetical protein
MRSLCTLLMMLLFGAAGGCTTDNPARSTAWFKGQPSLRGPAGPDVVRIEWALIERPVGDHYLNEDLWALANEQVVPLECKDVLENNGLRIAQLGGLLPAQFQEVVRSERSNPNPRRRHVRAGQATVLPLGPVRARCDSAPPGPLGSEGKRLEKMVNVQFGIAITPSLASDNNVRLSLTPQVQYGGVKTAIKPAEDGSGWTCREQAETAMYDALSWDAMLTPDEYLLVGCRFGSPQTFGQECFVRTEEPKPVQRLLVIRAIRQRADAAGTEGAEESAPPRAIASAVQASTNGVAR